MSVLHGNLGNPCGSRSKGQGGTLPGATNALLSRAPAPNAKDAAPVRRLDRPDILLKTAIRAKRKLTGGEVQLN